MLGMDLPKSVTIILKCGENLEYSVPGSKKTAKSRRWRVVFIGAKKKMATEEIEDNDGCPIWNSEVQLDLVNPSEPVVLLVLDGDKHQVGQVVIPLAQIPRSGPPNFDPQQLQYSELEETKKNSTPRGRLVYWIWATSYWPPGTKIGTKSKSVLSLRRSKTSRHSPSNVGALDDHGRSSPTAPSMMSGAYSESNYSGPSISYMGAAGVDDGHMSYIAAGTDGHSYNPLSPFDEAGTMPIIGSDGPKAAGKPPLYKSATHLGTDNDAGSTISTRSGKRGLRSKFRDKFSRSTQNLAKLANRPLGSGKLGSGDKGSQISLHSNRDQSPFPDSTSGALYRPTGHTGSITSLSRENYMPDGRSRPPGDERHPTGSTSTPQPSVANYKQDPMMPAQTSNESWGMHPEERPAKSIDQMSHREVNNYATQLERSSLVTRAEMARLQNDRDTLSKRLETSDSDLQEVRSQLADLRFCLLNAGLTEFLELPTSPSHSVAQSVPAYKPAIDRPITGQSWKSASMAQINETAGGGGSTSFLNKLNALTRKPVNGTVLDEPITMGTGQLTDWW